MLMTVFRGAPCGDAARQQKHSQYMRLSTLSAGTLNVNASVGEENQVKPEPIHVVASLHVNTSRSYLLYVMYIFNDKLKVTKLHNPQRTLKTHDFISFMF